MKHLLSTAAVVLSLAACGATISQTLLNDGNLLIAGLQTVSSTLTTAGAPIGDIVLVNAAVTALQTAETDLKAGTVTPAAFAKLAQDEMSKLAPAILTDLHANATITMGVTLAQNLIPVIAGDVAPVVTAPVKVGAEMTDPRGALRAWVNTVGKTAGK